MEVDVKRRRGAPWAAPVPAEIAGKIGICRRRSDSGSLPVIVCDKREAFAQESAAKQSMSTLAALDCFAALAMTAE